VVDGINKVQGYKLHVIKGSVNLRKELNNYCWMKDRHEAFTNTPIDKFNHAMDAMRYSTMSDRVGRATKKRYTKDELNFGF
jgi:phage terminase large subunit